MDPQELDALHALDDRTALAGLVERELAPPQAWVRLYGQVMEDRPSEDGSLPPAWSPTAVQEQASWMGHRLREQFLEAAAAMLEWTRRLRLYQAREHWSPFPWVYAARDMDALPGLMALVITQAPSLSWPSWAQAFDFNPEWAPQWEGWERAFGISPALASRWLDTVLAAPDSPAGPPRLERLSFCRARLWQQIQAAETVGRRVPLLQALDQKLSASGATRNLASVDYARLLSDGGQPLPAAQARDRLARFLASVPAETRSWLEQIEAPLAPEMAMGSDRAGRRGLALMSWLAAQGSCGAGDLERIFLQWAALLDDAAWAEVFDEGFFALLGLPPRRRSRTRKTRGSKAKKKKTSPTKVKGRPVPAAKPRPGPASSAPLEAIPRFTRR